MTDFIAGEKGVPIRYPSVANLMLDSYDRNQSVYSSPWDFQITKNYSIMNGFFTRIGTTEVVLEWCYPNINNFNQDITFDVSGATGQALNQTITFPTGFWDVAQVLDYMVEKLNDLSGTTGSTFGIHSDGTRWTLSSLNGGNINFLDQDEFIISRLFIPLTPGYYDAWFINDCPDIRLVRYLDFVSSQLTYCQDVKDNSTATTNKDVLCRWYMTWDNPPTYDAYDFPILMGYNQFQLRRIFNPPKQIKWDANQPIGNLSFQVYDQDGDLLSTLDPNNESNWLMTLQISEV